MAQNPFDDPDFGSDLLPKKQAKAANPFDDPEFGKPPKENILGDIASTAVKGVIAVPEAITGLADIATGGRAGKALENLGVRFKDAKEVASSWESDATKQARQEFDQAEGLVGKAQAALSNPRLIAMGIGESVPSMLAGGALARTAGVALPSLAGRVGLTAAGEGAVMAGSQAEQIRQQTEDGLLTGKQAGLAAATGVVGGALGALGGRAAKALGVGDVDQMAATGIVQNVSRPGLGIASRAGRGALTEGVFEELPQSLAETGLQNLALDRPFTQDMDSAAVMGTLTGGAMGAGAGVLSGMGQRPQAQPRPVTYTGAPSTDSPIVGTSTVEVDGKISTKVNRQDGSVDIDGVQVVPPTASVESDSTLPVDDVIEVEPITPVKPSEAMGIDRAAGPLSRAAADAVDSGASPAVPAVPAVPGLMENPLVQAAQAPAPTPPVVDVESLKDRTTEELRGFLRNAQDTNIRKAISSELARRKREEMAAMPDPLQQSLIDQPKAEQPRAAEAPQAVQSQPQAPQEQPRPLASLIGGRLTDTDAADLVGKTRDPLRGVIQPEPRETGIQGAANGLPDTGVPAVTGAGAGDTQRPSGVSDAGRVRGRPGKRAVAPSDAELANGGADRAGDGRPGTGDGNAALNGRPARWRQNALQAKKVARELGLNPDGKRLAEIVAEVDAFDARSNVQDAPQGTERVQAQAPADQAPEAARGDGSEAGRVPDTRAGDGVRADGVEGITRTILDSIADQAKKTNRKYYDKQIAKGLMTRDEADRRIANDDKMWAEQKVNDRTERIAKAIAEKDPTVLVGAWAKEGQGTYGNEGSMEAFRRLTGINLARMNSADRAKAIFDWAGWSEDQVRADVEKRRAERNEQIAKAEEKRKQDDAAGIERLAASTKLTIEGQDGETTVKAYIDGLIEQGYTEIGQTKVGAIKRTLLFRPGANSGYPMRGGILADYAKVASERFKAKQPPAQETKPAEKKAQEPKATELTPKQYHEAKLKFIADENGVSLAEVREMYDTEGGRADNNREWLREIEAAAGRGEVLTRQTLDKLYELAPNARMPESAFPDGYQKPEARKAEAEEKQARIDNRKEAKESVKRDAAETEYPLGRTDREDRFMGTRVRVMPELRGETAWEGEIRSTLNGGRLFTVLRDGSDAGSVRIPGSRIEILRVVDAEKPVDVPSTGSSLNDRWAALVAKVSSDGKDQDKGQRSYRAFASLVKAGGEPMMAAWQRWQSYLRSGDLVDMTGDQLLKWMESNLTTSLSGYEAGLPSGPVSNVASLQSMQRAMEAIEARQASHDAFIDRLEKQIRDVENLGGDEARIALAMKAVVSAKKAFSDRKREIEQGLKQAEIKEAQEKAEADREETARFQPFSPTDASKRPTPASISGWSFGQYQGQQVWTNGHLVDFVSEPNLKGWQDRMNTLRKDAPPANVDRVTPKTEGEVIKPFGMYDIDSSKLSRVFLEGDGKLHILNGVYYRYFANKYKGAEFRAHGANDPITVHQNGQMVGLVMGIRPGEGDTMSEIKTRIKESAALTAQAQASPQQQEAAEPFEHAGLKIRQSRVRVADEVETRWIVQSPENAEREARGERQISGDRIVESREDAIRVAEQEVKRYADEKAYKAEIDKAEQEAKAAAEARKEINRGKTLAERRADAILDKPTTLPPSLALGAGTKREAMQRAVEEGRLIREVMVRDTAAKKRDEDAITRVRASGYILGLSNENIPVVKAGLEAQARLKENKYEKPEYRVYAGRSENDFFREISKTEYDYAQSLKRAAEQPQQADKQGEKKPAEKIEDFGEKLPPSRRAMAAKLSEAISDEDIAVQPLSKIWPVEENEAIEDTFAAAVAHVMREAIPAKPRKGYKLNSWVGKVKVLRDFAAKILRGTVSRETFLAEMDKLSSLRDMRSKIKLLEQIDRAQWKRIGEVSEAPGAITYVDGKAVPQPSASVTVDGKSHWLRNSGDINDHVDTIKTMLEGDAPESKLKFEVFRATTGDRKVFISKKGDKEYRRLMEFDTPEQARKALKDQYAELVAAWEGIKGRDNITERDLRTSDNRPRSGKDWRKGKDVSAEEFQAQFGFRGGEFGKWVSQGKGAQERQFMLNNAYDALMDLSEILGVPPRAISLEGSLGIAFGSRGGGWASAHFEPSNLVINLTKPRGAGALAHEWFHALDNYFARKRNGGEVPIRAGVDAQNEYRRNNYITHKTRPMMVRKDGRGSPVTRERLTEWRRSSPDSAYLAADQWIEDPNHKQGVRAEVEERFDELVKALDASPMLQRARTLDGVKSGDGYWSRTLERAARSFENYVQTRMMEQGYHNDFLANVKAAPDVGKNVNRYPYLLPSEVAPIADAFSNLFQTIQTRETDDGNVEMYYGTKENSRQGTPVDRAVMDMAGEGRDANDILSFIANTSKSPYRRNLARKLLATGANPAVSLGGEMGGGAGFRFLAKYSRKNHEVTLSEAAGDRAEQIFLHETVHAATLLALDKGGLQAQQMIRLYESAKKQGLAEGQYGMKNVGEFVAEAFTNPEFQKILKSMKAPEGNLWKRFVALVRRILGMSDGSQDMLTAALEVGARVMRENMPLRAARSFRAEDGPAFAGSMNAMPENQAPGPQGDAQQGADKGNAVADGFVRLYHGGGQGVTEILEGGSFNRFDGLFASGSRKSAMSHGIGSMYYMDIPEDRMLTQRMLDYEIDNDKVSQALRSEMHWLDDADFDIAYEAVIEDRHNQMDEDSLIRVFREDDFGSASWEAQRIRGRVAKALGYLAVEMKDEHGTSYLVLPGVKVNPLNDQSAPETDGAFMGVNQTETPAFRRWFGDSKVVDADGKPLVVYHGTGADFSVFDENATAAHWKMDGFYFAPDPADASRFSESAAKIKQNRLGNAFRPDGANVMPVYLSLQKPKVIEFSKRGQGGFITADEMREMLAEAKFDGHDGAIIKGWQDGSGEVQYVAFRPEQIKSAIGNNGNFDPEDADIAHFGIADASTNNAREAVKQFDLKQMPRNTWGHYRGMLMQALGRRQIVDLYREELPQLVEYDRLVQQMDAEKNDTGAEADKLATEWGKLDRVTKKDGEERRLAELMHDATLAQIDPEKEFVAGDNRLKYGELKARFDSLTPEAQAIYRQTRNMYSDHYNKVREAIKDRIERSELSASRKKEMMAKMDDDFFKKVKGVYFPLARFGSYVMVTKDAAGDVVNVTRAETLNEAQEARRQIMSAFPKEQGYTTTKVMKDAEFNPGRDAVGKGFMADLFETLDKQGVDEALRDSVSQLYLSSLPDLSWAKHGIHRKGTPGFSQDARRAFAQNMFHGARYLAKLRYADQMQTQLDEMQDHIKAYSGVEEYDGVQAQQVVDEMVKRHDFMMNPKVSPVSTALTSIGFVFHLGLSPASAMVNLSQTALMAYPIMGAKWGFTRASTALLKASREVVQAKNDLSKALKGDELDAFNKAVKDGTIDVTMAHDLAGISQGEDQKVVWAMRPVMRAASFMFHHAERFNRQATFMAAYRLSKESGKSPEVAYEEAKKATYDGHFDYATSNRPRLMQGNWQKVIFLFKTFAQNMIYSLSRNAYLSVKGLDPAQRSEARKALAGILAAHAAAAGVLGLPLVGPLLAAASFIGGDDDEPWDAEVAMQNMMAEAFGPKAAEVIARGFSRLTPFDLSGRVALNKLILPDVYEGLEGQQWAESFLAGAAGPVAGIFTGMIKGLQKITDGDYQRGLEDMMPAALRGPLKALRYGSEGAVDKSGVVILDEVGPAGVASQALGFSPSNVRRSTERKGAIMDYDRALADRRSTLMRQWSEARMTGDEDGVRDVMEEIRAFNQKNPRRAITPPNLLQSYRARMKRINEADEGVYLPKNRRDAMDQVRF